MTITTGLIECKREDMLAALQIVMPAIERRNTIPILGYLKIDAGKKTITVEGTDLDVTVRHIIKRIGSAAKVSVTVPAHDFFDFVKTAGAPDLWIKIVGAEATMKAGAARTLPTLPVADWPNDREYETPIHTRFVVEPFREATRIVKPAISTEGVRYYLQGIFFEAVGKEEMQMTATDGHRLHSTKIWAEGIDKTDTALSVIVPAVTVNVVDKWLGVVVKAWKKSGGTAPMLDVQIGKAGINFVCGATTIRSKIVDGTYPDWRGVIPRKPEGKGKEVIPWKQTSIIAELSDVEAAIKRVANLRNGSFQGVKFSFTKGICVLSRRDPDTGTVSDTIKCDYAADAFEITFNGRYVRDILDVLNDGKIVLKVTNSSSPAVWEKARSALPLIVLMPMRV